MQGCDSLPFVKTLTKTKELIKLTVEVAMKPCDSSLHSEALLKFEGYKCTDNGFIFVLVAKGNNIGNSQTTKQM